MCACSDIESLRTEMNRSRSYWKRHPYSTGSLLVQPKQPSCCLLSRAEKPLQEKGRPEHIRPKQGKLRRRDINSL